MNDKEFQQLKIEIEIAMHELAKLQKTYNDLTGQDYVMPIYLDTPSWIRRVK